MTISIRRRTPRDGVEEHPWQNGQGRYVLGDPAHGRQKHQPTLEVKVQTLKEVVTLIERGFSLRMSRNGKRESMISPGSLIVEIS